jgi:hypothetical protein
MLHSGAACGPGQFNYLPDSTLHPFVQVTPKLAALEYDAFLCGQSVSAHGFPPRFAAEPPVGPAAVPAAGFSVDASTLVFQRNHSMTFFQRCCGVAVFGNESLTAATSSNSLQLQETFGLSSKNAPMAQGLFWLS